MLPLMYLSVVQVLHGQPRIALSQTLPRKATVGQGELQAGGRQKWWWGSVIWQDAILENKQIHNQSERRMWEDQNKTFSHHFGVKTAPVIVFSPCQEMCCGQRGLWRERRADTLGSCSSHCCSQTSPNPACPGLSSSPREQLQGDRRMVGDSQG